jgi:translin
MRNGSLVNAERMLGLMEDIYESLITFDYPDGMTGGLRRTCDALRAVLERTRSDLTLTAIQRQLMQDLRSAQGKG